MRLTRRSLAATAVVAAVLAAGGCGTSFNAQTSQQYQAGTGADSRSTPVQVLAALAVVSADGSATLSATLINTTDTDQRLTSVTLTAADGTELAVTSADVEELTIAPGQTRTLGRVDDGTHDHKSKIYTVAGIEPVGAYYTLTLTFADAGEVTIDIPTVRRSAAYADVALPPGADPAENSVGPGETFSDEKAEEKAEDESEPKSGGEDAEAEESAH